ncbi:uncharacterized protein LOC141554048 [Sminthopsis crassicaudata]|uniref:uncharacterized protein LOC141554048 n=1 Tax=Sminthopsis crassicaudata TaxID=9301 RepID=UPI003D6951D1
MGDQPLKEEREPTSSRAHFNAAHQHVKLTPPGLSSKEPSALRTLKVVLVIFICLILALVATIVYVQIAKTGSKSFSTQDSGPQMLKDSLQNAGASGSPSLVPRGSLGNASVEIQLLKEGLRAALAQAQLARDSVSAQIQALREELERVSSLNSRTERLGGPPGNASAEIQVVKGSLESLTTQAQALRRDLEKASAEMEALRRDLGNASALPALAWELRRGLELTHADIQKLKSDLGGGSPLSPQVQRLQGGLENTDSELQRLKKSLQEAAAFLAQAQTLGSRLESTRAEMRGLSGRLEKTDAELELLKRGLGGATEQAEAAVAGLRNASVQIHMLRGELGSASALGAEVGLLKSQLERADVELQTLKEGLKEGGSLAAQIQALAQELARASQEIQSLKAASRSVSQIPALRSDLDRANGEIQMLRERLAAVLAPDVEIQKLRSQLEAVTQQQHTVQASLLQLVIEGWRFHQGKAYYFSTAKKPWSEAEEFCVARGSHLASVTSAEEQEFLGKGTNGVYHWIGLTDKGTEGNWRWVDGTPFNSVKSKRFWNSNQPDNWNYGNGVQEDCVHSMEKWNDIICEKPFPWICKKNLENLFPH